MSTELVTAHAGQNHVDSADIGELYAGAFGSGRYALDVGERLAVGMTDANTLHIGTGGFIFDGRWVRVTGSGEDIKIANGGQGMFRKDLVAYVYSRDPSSGNIESGSWVVVQGEPASTEAAATAPAIDEGSILDGDLKAACAVAEVDVAGLTPTAKLLLPCVASLKAVGDSVSRIKIASGGAHIYGCDVTLDVSYIPAIQSLVFDTKGSGVMTTGTQTGNSFKALTLPSNYRPANERSVCFCANLQFKFSLTLRIQPNGDVMFDVTSSEPMNAFGWTSATGFIPL